MSGQTVTILTRTLNNYVYVYSNMGRLKKNPLVSLGPFFKCLKEELHILSDSELPFEVIAMCVCRDILT